MAGREPQRRCVACGRVAAKRELLRLALAPAGESPAAARPIRGSGPSTVLADPAARMPGRGAYVCEQRACREQLARPGKLARAFRGAVSIDPETLESLV